jgi:hypothetical protein
MTLKQLAFGRRRRPRGGGGDSAGGLWSKCGLFLSAPPRLPHISPSHHLVTRKNNAACRLQFPPHPHTHTRRARPPPNADPPFPLRFPFPSQHDESAMRFLLPLLLALLACGSAAAQPLTGAAW